MRVILVFFDKLLEIIIFFVFCFRYLKLNQWYYTKKKKKTNEVVDIITKMRRKKYKMFT